MKIKINAVGFSVSSSLEEFINKKLSKVIKYNDAILGVDVSLKLDKDDSLENKFVEVRIDIKGNDIFVKKNARTFEEAIDELYDVLKRQLVKVKEREREK